eukprot:365811-Chlamydomonas_euryale.AAC.5
MMKHGIKGHRHVNIAPPCGCVIWPTCLQLDFHSAKDLAGHAERPQTDPCREERSCTVAAYLCVPVQRIWATATGQHVKEHALDHCREAAIQGTLLGHSPKAAFGGTCFGPHPKGST